MTADDAERAVAKMTFCWTACRGWSAEYWAGWAGELEAYAGADVLAAIDAEKLAGAEWPPGAAVLAHRCEKLSERRGPMMVCRYPGCDYTARRLDVREHVRTAHSVEDWQAVKAARDA